jgi:hypothetical protein
VTAGAIPVTKVQEVLSRVVTPVVQLPITPSVESCAASIPDRCDDTNRFDSYLRKKTNEEES